MSLATVSLDDKYTLESGRVYLTGIQALVRLPLMQRRRDAAAGLNPAGFISGYRGSPLGGYDQALWQARRFLEKQHVHFEPGVNEDLAATAVWGSQQLNLFKGAAYDGVFAIWYGKGPGVDRSGDALRHGNAAGSSRHGGVLVVAGDDHGAISSTLAHQSEHSFMAWMTPVLNPSTIQEYLDYGLMGIAMSRYSGCWVSMMCVTETVESSASIAVGPDRIRPVIPTDFEMPPGGLHIRWPDERFDQEIRLQRYKIYAALAFGRANRLDRIVLDSSKPRLGIITSGKAYKDTMQALEDLGIDQALAEEIGLRVYKVGMTWPLEREGARAFALQGPGHAHFIDPEPDLFRERLVDAQILERLHGVLVGLARGDDAEARLRAVEDDAVQPVGTAEGQRRIYLVALQADLLVEALVRPANVQAAGRHLEIGRDHRPDPIRSDRDRGRAFHRLGDAHHADPAARVTGHGDAHEPVVEVFLDGRRVQHRRHPGHEAVLALVGERGRDGAVVVASDHQHAAVPRAAGGVAVAKRVAGAVDAGPLAVPDGEDAVVRSALEQVELLAAPDRGRRQVLVDAGLEMDVLFLQEAPRLPKRLVVAAERRAAIAGDETRRVEARRRIAPALHQRQADQGLDAGQIDAAGFEGVLVVEGHCGQTHAKPPTVCGRRSRGRRQSRPADRSRLVCRRPTLRRRRQRSSCRWAWS